MIHIVNFSGGLCSFWAARRTIDRHGLDGTVLLFADVLIEDPDIYDFNQRASALLGLPITRVCAGLTPWQLFRREGLIGNNQSPICSIQLKREPLNAWMDSHYELDRRQVGGMFPEAAIVLGFDWNEAHRVRRFQDEHPHWRVEAPMLEEPIWDKCRMQKEAAALGLPLASLYAQGFPHNNCGGRCVRAGISHFVHLHQVRPAAFLEWELEEIATQEEFKRRGIDDCYTVLRDRRNHETKPLSLRSLRLRIEAGEEFDKFDWGGCGCGA